MKVPLLDLTLHYAPIRDQVMAAIERVIDGNAYILGPEVAAFERRIAEYCGSKHAIGVSSGTDALLLALMGLDIGPGDEVITTPYSFFATAGCIVRLGARPVFVDIDPQTYNIDPLRIDAVLSSKTKAIIPVHLFGQCADMEPILEWAEENSIAVVEDAAQAIGAQYMDGSSAGTMGRCGCFSFFPSKNLGGMGDGGMVVTDDDQLAEKFRVLRAHGAKPKYHHKLIGGNFRLDAIQAAVLNVKLDYLNDWSLGRQQNAAKYESEFADSDLPEVKLPFAAYRDSGVERWHIYNQFMIRVADRDGLQQHLSQAGVGTALYYPLPFHQQECFADLGYTKGDFPESELASQSTLALPISPEVTEDQIDYVVSAVQEFYALKRTGLAV